MHPDSEHKGTFITQSGVYKYKRMPYGLMNAPVSFQMVMTQVLRGLTWRQCLIYLDNILVSSKTFDDHLSHLEQIFSRLRQAYLKLKSSKCDFAAKEIKYLGYIISKHGVRTDPNKTKAVSSFPVPKTQKDGRSFLGMCNYYRKFVKDYAKLSSPLNNLLRKDLNSTGLKNVSYLLIHSNSLYFPLQFWFIQILAKILFLHVMHLPQLLDMYWVK